MQIPLSTYRLQLHASFTFQQVQEIIDYLQQLGITTIYASPFFTASAGSTHGYDVSDPQVISPEIGTLDQLTEISRQLRQHGMTWLQDIVPNHMLFAVSNKSLADVLERGPFSRYYKYFDINWQHPDPSLNGRMMVPFLGKALDACVQDGEITLEFNQEGLFIKYFTNNFPLSVNTYQYILSLLPDEQSDAPVSNGLYKLYNQAIGDPSLPAWQQNKQALLQDLIAHETHVTVINELVATINQDKALLTGLLQQQYYQLTHWQDTDHTINYRRFFAVNELISINMGDEAVFNDYHPFIHQLYQQQLIHGLRIDHIDGLSDPETYSNRLRRLFGDDCYIVVEKILEQGEVLPAQWPLQGTTGYEFLSWANWLLTNRVGAQKLVDLYRRLFPKTDSYEDTVYKKKKAFLTTYMAGDWENLVTYMYTLELAPGNVSREELKQALGLFICCMPVYRLYPNDQPLDADSAHILEQTFKETTQKGPEYTAALQILKDLWQPQDMDPQKENVRVAFLQRLMQFTGPVMAKGVEDTTFYVYNALLSHNEVGDTPNAIGFPQKEFHACVLQRQQTHPFSMNATSTHDTKRGEDGRIRLNVLTLLADEWEQQVQQWRQINGPLVTQRNPTCMPDLQDEYFIYQSVLAGFPAGGQVTPEFTERLKAYFIKAVREAKINSNWQSPDTQYEEAVGQFIERILSAGHGFISSFLPFFEKVQQYATLFSLAQVLVKITAPGVPDIYQGSELWNTSYVDPDNRRPVDYTIRKKYLQELQHLEKTNPSALLAYVAGKRGEGMEKLFVTWKALQCRKKFSSLFLMGDYQPVYASGDSGVAAFIRHYQHQWALIIVPVMDSRVMVERKDWGKGITLSLPNQTPVGWTNAFTREVFFSSENGLLLENLFDQFPVLLLTGETDITVG